MPAGPAAQNGTSPRTPPESKPLHITADDVRDGLDHTLDLLANCADIYEDYELCVEHSYPFNTPVDLGVQADATTGATGTAVEGLHRQP